MSTLTQTIPQYKQQPKQPTDKQIPVIRTVIRDEELSRLKDAGVKLPLPLLPKNGCNQSHLSKLLKLMSDKHSKGLVHRHSVSVEKLSRVYVHGIHVKDVGILVQLMHKCWENVDVDTTYEQLLCSLVKLVGKLFLKTKVSDEHNFLAQVSDNIRQLGALAQNSSDKVKVAVCNAMTSLYNCKEHTQHFSDCRPVSKKFIDAVVEKSEVCRALALCMSQVSDSDNRLSLLHSLNHLSDSTSNCNDMLQGDVAACICSNLAADMHSYNLLFVAIETLWNIIDHGDNELVAKQISTNESVRALGVVFAHQMKRCHSYADRQLRNDIVVIISQITMKFPDLPLVECGLAKALSMFAVYPEIPTNDNAIQRLKLTPAPEDFEIKKLLLNMMAVLSKNSLALSVMSRHHVIDGLFTYVVPIKHGVETMWTMNEYEELQLQALAVLAILCPLNIADYTRCYGNSRLLAFLDWCVSVDQFSGHGNSFYGNGGGGSKRAQMKLCIRVLRNMCATADEQVCDDLTDQGLINQLVAILLSCSSCLATNDSMDVEIQCDMLFMLGSLCEGSFHRKSLFGEEGVKMLLQYLQGYMGATKDLLTYHRLVLVTLDTTSAVVIGCYTNEIDWLKREGAFMLLDLLEVCPSNMKNMVLVLILDLLENPCTVQHLTLWRGNGEKTIAKMLTQMWAEEERRLGVHRDSYGVITDISRPLLTTFQEVEGVRVLATDQYTAAVVDVSDNLRSKIYGVFCKIGFNNLPGLESADYIVLSVIEKYLDFKTLEVWNEIQQELEMEGIEAIPHDKKCMEEIIFILQNKALTVAVVQKALIQTNFEQAVVEEKDFFDRIKETYKQGEKAYEDFAKYIERTSNYTVLKRTKEEQLAAIDRSRVSVKPSALREGGVVLSHPTLERKLQTTTFCGRHLVVESTKFAPSDAPLVK